MSQDSLTNKDVGVLTRFKNKADEFMKALSRLNEIDNVPPNLQEEYSGLRSTADYIESTVTTITSTVDSVTGFFSDFFSFDGVGATRDYINNKPSQMGLIPLVPIAVISGALALMSKFISDVYLFERKVGEQKRLEATGLKPKEAARIVGKMTDKGLIEQMGTIAKPLGLALAAYFGMRMFKSYFK